MWSGAKTGLPEKRFREIGQDKKVVRLIDLRQPKPSMAGRQEQVHARQNNPPVDQIISAACRALSLLIVE
jgi:hypothetical protein